MKFVIKDKDGRGLFSTEYPQCVPIDKIDSMNSVGFQFYVDGKKISAANVKFQFKDVEPVVLEESCENNVELEPSDEFDFSSVDFPITSRTIVCMNNKKIYRNQKEAGEDLNIDPSYISYSISQNKPYKGYSFLKAVDMK